LGEEAKAFYEEVIQKFPKSSEATKAQAKLKSLSAPSSPKKNKSK
jgi:TolA-binding protein